MKRLTVVAVSLVLTTAAISTSVIAAPRVSGSNITWPDDGWYQVLNADDYSEICGGGSSCEVGPGRYIVINHTTGQRFENVVVRDRSGAAMPVTVSGNTISWPDDGWYQVQRADDYSTVCEGVRQCDVEDGVYNVINHTAGRRFTGILVDASDSDTDPDVTPMPPTDPDSPESPVGPDANGITVFGNVISWPDNGWYQVQSLDNFESICEGGTSCAVPEGVYVVINHTTGERFEPYLITGDAVVPVEPGEPGTDNGLPAGQIPIPVNARLDEAAPYLIESLAAYQLEHIQAYVETLGEEIVSTAIAATVLEPTSIQVNVFEEVLDVVKERTEYACSGGGTMLREEAILDIDYSDYSQDNLSDRWSFLDCRIDTDAADLLSGEHVINGELTKVEEYKSGRRFTNLEQAVSFEGFTLDAPGDNGLTIDANATIRSLDTLNPSSSRNVVINEYQEVRNGGVLRDIRDADFRFLSSGEAAGAIENRSFYANGRILGSVTQGMDVTISTVETFQRTGVINEDFSSSRVPFTGQMQLSSTDGAEMTITAKPDAPDFIAPLLYDYTLMTTEGDTITGESQPLPNFAIQTPETAFYQR